MTQRQQAILHNRVRRKIEAQSAAASRRGKMGVAARQAKIQREGAAWNVVREIRIFNPQTGVTILWKISATGNPPAPLALEIDGKWNLLRSERGIRSLLAKAIWKLK